MAMYICANCGQYKDNDYDLCNEPPYPSPIGELWCTCCTDEYNDERCDWEDNLNLDEGDLDAVCKDEAALSEV